jgi:hypothetical protein
MPLPIVQCPSESFTLPDGTLITIRGMSRAEVLAIQVAMANIEDESERAVQGEKLALAKVFDVTVEEAEAWMATVPNGVSNDISKVISRLSGLDPDLGKDVAGGSPSVIRNGIESITSSQNNSGSH